MKIQPNPENGIHTANKVCMYAAIGFVVFVVLASTGLLIPLVALAVFGGGAVAVIWGLAYLFGAFRDSDRGRERLAGEERRVPPFGPSDPWAGSGKNTGGRR